MARGSPGSALWVPKRPLPDSRPLRAVQKEGSVTLAQGHIRRRAALFLASLKPVAFFSGNLECINRADHLHSGLCESR